MWKNSLTFVFFAFIIKIAVSSEWNYWKGSMNGPHNWATVVPESSCGGPRQSPIDIVTSTAQTMMGYEQLAIVDINKMPQSITYKNTGHGYSVDFTFADGVEPNLVRGPLGSERYVFASFHMHWRSEHTLNNNSYPAELHMVHYNKKYGSLEAAIPNTDGLAVLGFFISRANVNTIRPMVQVVSSIMDSGATVTTTTQLYSLLDILKIRRFPVYSYPGSLTTPGCNEVVTWLVSPHILSFTTAELDLMKSIKDSHAHTLSKNNRPTQPLNGRALKFYP